MDDYEGEKFLNRLYFDLHMSDEVMHTSSKSDNKEEKVRKYLDRLKKVEDLALSSKQNGLDLLKELYYKKYVIKEEDIPKSYFELQKKIALDRGFGHVEIDKETRKEMSKSLIDDQKKSLDIWLEYLINKDSIYPEWFKYYAFQGMIKLGSYDKEKEIFNRRTNKTTNIFIELNREALAMTYDNIELVLNNRVINDEELKQLIDNGSFGKIYSHILKKLEKNRKDIDSNDGVWIKYNQGEDPEKLVDSLQGRGTGWCTAGYETAKSQLSNGDFYVYYTKDSSGEYKQPRIAIRMDGKDKIGEIRGIAEHQNLESEMENILKEKLKEFPDRDKYFKKEKDMEKLTQIYKEYKTRKLTIEEMKFLYEVDEKIEGFGYRKDPRIEEILKERNLKKDLSQVFNCNEDEISNNKQDVLDGKKIFYFHGNLDLRSLTSAEGLVLPEKIDGDLVLSSLTSAEGIVLPKEIGGYLDLESLTSAEGLILPKEIGGCLYLSSLTSAEGLILPKEIGKVLYLGSLTSAEGLVLPEKIGGDLGLSSLTSAEGLVLPEKIGRDLDLGSLTSAEGLVLPEKIDGDLKLSSLTSAEGLILPEKIDGDLGLSSLTSAEGLILPKEIGGCLYLNSLTSAEGLILPKKIGKVLYLGSLTSAEGLVLPEYIGGKIYANDDIKEYIRSEMNKENKKTK